MWICSCHAVNDGMIKEFAKKHGNKWKLMTQELKVATQCGSCAIHAKEVLEKACGIEPKPRRPRRAARLTAIAKAGASTRTRSTTSEITSEITSQTASEIASQTANQPAVVDTPSSDGQSANSKTLPVGGCGKQCPCGKFCS